MKKTDNLKVCKRCNRRNTKETICQSCKTELLSNYEAASDWQIAYEIERVQQYTARYFQKENDFDNL
jgi:recombinational DNA repair protein RecR